jgi:hypothetical protein
MRGAVPPLPQHVFMAWCLVKHMDNFTFTFTQSGNFWIHACNKRISGTSYQSSYVGLRFLSNGIAKGRDKLRK